VQEAAAWLTQRELADRLGVSESTVSNWRRRYGDLIPSALGVGGFRCYPLRPFEMIAAMRKRGRPAEDIRAALAEDGPEPPEIEDSASRVATALEQIARDLRRIADALAPEGD
jgi:DNA-binding transcriptional MerR regulator